VIGGGSVCRVLPADCMVEIIRSKTVVFVRRAGEERSLSSSIDRTDAERYAQRVQSIRNELAGKNENDGTLSTKRSDS